MTNEKIFAREMMPREQLNQVCGGAVKVKPSLVDLQRNNRNRAFKAIGNLISKTIIYILEKNRKK